MRAGDGGVDVGYSGDDREQQDDEGAGVAAPDLGMEKRADFG